MTGLEPRENIYGSLNRLKWFKKFITKNDVIVDLGCGTGSMVTIPLIVQGYNVVGIDLDEKSIEYGKNLLKFYGLDETRLICADFKDCSIKPTIIILSQVIEHLSDESITVLMKTIFSKLTSDGKVLVTVPNGYGLFEFESFLWYKMRLGFVLEKLYITRTLAFLKKRIVETVDELHPSSLDSSPHVQRFTYFSIEKKLKKYGFSAIQKTGGSFCSGPFSNILFSGINPIIRFNLFLGSKIPALAADFYVAFQKSDLIKKAI